LAALILAAASWLPASGEEPAPPDPAKPPVFSVPDLGKSGLNPNRPIALVAEPPAGGGEARPVWENPLGLDANFLQKYEDQWGMLSSKTVVRDSIAGPDNAGSANKWQTESELRMNVHGPVYLFSEVNTGCDALENQELKLNGKSGVACKLEGWSRWELLLRGGPAVSCADPLRPERYKQESDLLLELQCRCPLPGRVNLEYESTATPALSADERDRLKQDLRLAVPLGNLGKVSVGAKHSWENTPAPRPWTDGMQLYIGVDLKR
jgi:hypothetical protein